MTEPEQQPATPAAEPAPTSGEATAQVPATPEPVVVTPEIAAAPAVPPAQEPVGAPVHDPFATPAQDAFAAPAATPTYPAQVFPAQVFPAQPDQAQQYPGQPYPVDPNYAATAGFPAVTEPPKKGKALKIVAIVLAVAFVLCVGGGLGAFFMLRNTEGVGAASASDAAEVFLEAVYEDYDVAAAEKITCADVRDRKALQAKIDSIKAELAKLKNPTVNISNPKISDETATQANATVTIKIVTSDEKESEQKLTLVLAKHEGWFVCEVAQG